MVRFWMFVLKAMSEKESAFLFDMPPLKNISTLYSKNLSLIREGFLWLKRESTDDNQSQHQYACHLHMIERNWFPRESLKDIFWLSVSWCHVCLELWLLEVRNYFDIRSSLQIKGIFFFAKLLTGLVISAKKIYETSVVVGESHETSNVISTLVCDTFLLRVV